MELQTLHVDKLSPERRSANMARIKSKNSKPEMIVRRLAHKLGYRYRLHDKNLPGKPDLVFAKHRAVIFVHGCFWHQHPEPSCRDAVLPKSRLDYWLPKLERNQKRDAENIAELEEQGWRVMVIWECSTKNFDDLAMRLTAFLKS